MVLVWCIAGLNIEKEERGRMFNENNIICEICSACVVVYNFIHKVRHRQIFY